MKLFFKHIILFGIIFFIVEKGLFYFIEHAPSKEYDKRLQLVLDGKMNKDIVIIGSSRGANNISAKQIEEETGLSTYNLSYKGTNVTFHEFILETLLIYNKSPKKLLLVIDNGYEFLVEKSLNFRYDKLTPLKNYKYINDKLILGKKKNVLSRVFNLAKIDREDFSLKSKRVYPVNKMTSHGSKLLKIKDLDTLSFMKRLGNYNISKEDLNKIKSFKSIQKLCKSNNIELYFVFTPGYLEFDKSFLKRFKTLTTVQEQFIIYDTINEVYKNKSLFSDHTHMNFKGAKIFTSEISSYLNKKIRNLPFNQ